MKPFHALTRIAPLALAGLLAACGGGAGDRIYDACIDQIDEGLKQATAQMGAQANSEEMMATMRTAAQATCETLRTTCNNEPDNAMCKSALAELGG